MLFLIYLIGSVVVLVLTSRRVQSWKRTPYWFSLPERCFAKKCSHGKLWKCFVVTDKLGVAYLSVCFLLLMFVVFFPEYIYLLFKFDFFAGP